MNYHSPKCKVAILISLWALFLRASRLAQRELWGDELVQLERTVGQFKLVWFRNYYGDFSNFPGDYILTYPFQVIFGSNKWGLAIPHIIATIIGLCFLYLICTRHYKTVWGYIIAFVCVCFNSNLIFHSFEFRPYAVLPTLALGVFYFMERIVFDYDELGKVKRRWIAAFLLFTASFHALSIIFIVFSFVYSIVSRRVSHTPINKEVIKYLSKCFIGISLIWLWYASLNLNILGSPKIWIEPRLVFDYIPNPIVDVTGFLKGVIGNLFGSKPLYVLLVGIVGAFLIPTKERFRQIGFFLLFIVMGIESVLLITLLKGYWFLQRQFIWIMPLFAFFIGWAWDSIIIYFKKKEIK